MQNIKIQTNIIDTAWKNKVKRLLFLGSSCIYPKFAQQPIVEESLLSGSLENTNEWYAIAKISGIKLCQALRIQYGFLKMKIFYKYANLEYRIRRLERAQYWKDKYKR